MSVQILQTDAVTRSVQVSRWFLRLAIVYLVCGIGLGMYMGAHEDFTFMPLHAHINLLGWVTSAIFALTYRLVPDMARTRLAWIHVIVSTVGFLLMMTGLAFLLQGDTSLKAVLITGETLSLASILIFAWLLFTRF
ncbi:MAG: cbb3-type cytochrome c oxidase subunit I [Pseudomonadota bacterium]|nr:cbb3-type cytochrome c oxidase subunit I [Pseudomonadota bacterium]